MAPIKVGDSLLWYILIIVLSVGLVSAQNETCYSPGSMAASIILTIFFTFLLVAILYYLWKKYQAKKGDTLILETDPEKGKGEYAFDNPGFREPGLTPIAKSIEKLESSKPKWNQWSPLAALTTKSEKRKTVDDSVLENNEVKVVALRSHDFTGLGFNVCGNMKEGIYIKDILHRGPAFESGKLNPGDRINSVTISFEHMVYEDALTILSYASPYEVIIEARSGKIIHNTTGQGAQPSHPVYRSSSCTDLYHVMKSSKKRLFGEEYNDSMSSNYSSLQKSRSNMTTLERKESKSPKPNFSKNKKSSNKHLSPDQLKTTLEQKILSDHQQNLRNKNEKPIKEEIETQKSENKHQKFGIRVLPMEQQQKSPKSAELSQNDNNINIEKNQIEMIRSIDEVDNKKQTPPQAKKREKKVELTPEKTEETFIRQNSVNGSGIKRDENGIPQEIPSHMFNAAVAARKNRKNSEDNSVDKDDDDSKSNNKKSKGKAPSPPEEKMKDEKLAQKNNFDEIHSVNDEVETITKINKPDELIEKMQTEEDDVELRIKDNSKGYNSDSDVETDNQSSVNTIELNPSEITIHQAEDEEIKNRKTASTGDLTKIQKTRKSSTGTLERAQSLDITDTGIPTLNKKRKGGRIEDSFDMTSDEDICAKTMLSKEPRLSLILDGLNTTQRNRLKKSTEWGNLEDAILKLNQEDTKETPNFDENISVENLSFNFGEKSPEFDALVNKVNEIKRESQEIVVPVEIINKCATPEDAPIKPPKKKNDIWPNLDSGNTQKQSFNGVAYKFSSGKIKESMEKRQLRSEENNIEKRSPPSVPERTSILGGKPKILEKETVEISKPEVVPRPSSADRRQIKPAGYISEEPSFSTKTILNENKQKDEKNEPSKPTVTEELTAIEIKYPLETKDNVTVDPKLDTPLLHEEWEISVTGSVPKKIITDDLPTANKIETEVPAVEVPTASNKTTTTTLLNKSEETMSKPLSNTNNTDETKTVVTKNARESYHPNPLDITQNFLFTEKIACSEDTYRYPIKSDDINVSDDIKVSRHSLGSLEREKSQQSKSDLRPKSDDAKSVDSLMHVSNVSNVTINKKHPENGDSELHSLELSINEPSIKIDDSQSGNVSELYTTALDNSVPFDKKDTSKVTITTPDLIKNVTLTEAINTSNSDVRLSSPPSLDGTMEKELVEIMENKFSTLTNNESLDEPINDISNKTDESDNSNKSNSTLTYITEIQVITPNDSSSNISEIEIIPNSNNIETNGKNLDNRFENYVKNFQDNVTHFESNIDDFETSLDEFVKKEPKSIIINEKIDAEKELHKIQEIAEEQLKKLPEMRFTTSSYEGSKIPEKRQSQIEALRSNFEKSPPKLSKSEVTTKSRIPIATTAKTPPTSPERRDSRNLDMENEKEILELMSSSVHSTPVVSNAKFTSMLKSPSKNVTVTSIRNSSRIPSGLPTLGGNSRPPIPPRRLDSNDGDSLVQVSSVNGNVESSFKQWVFNPSNNSVTNIVVSPNNKHDQK